MAEKSMFGTQAFGGYNKVEVDAYLGKLSLENTSALEQLHNECEELKNALSEKDSALTEKDSSFNELLAAYEELRQHYMLLKEKSDSLEFENEKLKAKLTEAQDCFEKLEEDNKKNNGACVSIDQIENSAKTILGSAKDGARIIVHDAQQSVGNVSVDLNKLKLDAERAKNALEDSFAAVIARIETLSDNLSSVGSENNTETLTESAIHDKYEVAIENINRVVKSVKDNIFN